MNRTILKQKGFTLVETLVSLSILMLAILGPLTVASSGLRNSVYARDQITAYYLAQEGIEYVRYVRDDNYIRRVRDKTPLIGWDWLAGLTLCRQANGCAIDITNWFDGDYGDDATLSCGDSACTARSLKETVSPKGFYTYQVQTGGNTNTLSRFNRVVKITTPSDGNDKEVEVTSTVTWKGAGQQVRTISVKENIMNIYKSL